MLELGQRSHGVVGDCQHHVPRMPQEEGLLLLPDRGAQMRSFVGALELGIPDAGKMWTALAVRLRRHLQPPQSLVVYLSPYWVLQKQGLYVYLPWRPMTEHEKSASMAFLTRGQHRSARWHYV